jgi:hypothetical protein
MSFEPIAVRVRRGAALLDQVRPGWWREIATDRLAMDCSGSCILGQLYRHYWHGVQALTRFLPLRERVDVSSHGFNLLMPEQEPAAWGITPDPPWDELTACWRAEIAARAGDGGES